MAGTEAAADEQTELSEFWVIFKLEPMGLMN